MPAGRAAGRAGRDGIADRGLGASASVLGAVPGSASGMLLAWSAGVVERLFRAENMPCRLSDLAIVSQVMGHARQVVLVEALIAQTVDIGIKLHQVWGVWAQSQRMQKQQVAGKRYLQSLCLGNLSLHHIQSNSNSWEITLSLCASGSW